MLLIRLFSINKGTLCWTRVLKRGLDMPSIIKSGKIVSWKAD